MLRDSLDRLLASLALVLVLAVSTVRAADKIEAKESGPQKITDQRGTKLLKFTAAHPTAKEPLVCLIDVNDAEDLEQWATHAAKYALKWYPEIEKTLASDGFTPPREFRIVIKHDKGVAYTTGTVVTINYDYVSKHKDDLGMVAHELTHVIQKYRRGEGWITEGIADYVRYYVVEPGSKRAGFNAERQSYKGGYQAAAGMIAWIEKTKGPGIVSKLNAALRTGKYSADFFKETVGGTPDEMWEAFKESKKTK
jgi:hypothetical protein